jgi:two-component system CitB family sensor kinase
VARPKALSALILRYMVATLVVTMLLGAALFAWVTRDLLDRLSEQRALAVAESVATSGEVRSQLASGDRSGLLQSVAEQARHATNADYVVIIDAGGVRHSHPNPALIGERIEEPVVALDGRSHVGIDPGSLGNSANGKAPVRGPDRRVVGEVSVGFLESTVSRQLWREIPVLLLYTGAALLCGLLTSLVLARRLKRITFGLELEDLAALLQEREATLHGVREGVVAFDNEGRLTMANDEARRLLRSRLGPVGSRLESPEPPADRLHAVLSGAVLGPDLLVLTDEHLLVANRMPVQVRGRDVGAVVTLRDRTELEALLRELDSVNGLTDALRAQQHEFSNRLHVLSVLVGMGEADEAMAYLDDISATSAAQAEDLRSRLTPPALAALLLAKITVAAERGILLTLAEGAALDRPGPDPRALLTIVGNLVDNALDAVADSPPPRSVVVGLGYAEATDRITITVSDNGPGIAPELIDRVFQDGYTSKARQGQLQRGLGLALVHRIVHRLGGSIRVSPGPGATFTVSLAAGARSAVDDARPAVADVKEAGVDRATLTAGQS